MAELVVMGATRQSGVRCSAEELNLLKSGCNRSIAETVHAGNHGDRITQSMQRMLADPKNRDRHVPLDDWNTQDAENVLAARREYMHSWAFCYLLLHNPNYALRFKSLGQGYVTRRPDAFDELFGAMRQELAFEYAFFLRNVDQGYRVDLCNWDWQKRFQTIEMGKPVTSRIVAARGFQPTGAMLTAGQRYSYQADGTWSTAAGRTATTADGDSHSGRLVGVVLRDFELSEPIPLGVKGTFVAPVEGKLYLRCEDAWNELQDNQGEVLVRLRRG